MGLFAARVAVLIVLLLSGLLAAGPARRQGLVPDDAQTTARVPRAPRYRAYLPPSADVSARLPRAGDQGASTIDGFPYAVVDCARQSDQVVCDFLARTDPTAASNRRVQVTR